MRSMTRWIATVGLALTSCQAVHAQVRLFVDDDAAPGGDGASWASAFDDLATALDHVAAQAYPAAEIWVAAGTYLPADRTDPNDPRSATFRLRNGLAIYGGFAGDEDPAAFDLADRDLVGNESNLSGSSGGYANYHVVSAAGVDSTAQLDGFTVRDGYALDTWPAPSSGAGLYNDGGSPRVANCRFQGNVADNGGAIHNTNGAAPTIVRCLFANNRAPGDDGGAIYNTDSSPTIEYCTFDDNWADNYGGAVRSVGGATILRDCTFNSNWVADSGGGAVSGFGALMLLQRCNFITNNHIGEYYSVGGALDCRTGSASLEYCTFEDNYAGWGGAIYAYDSDISIRKCQFRQNRARDYGAAIRTEYCASLAAQWCVFQGNDAGSGGGAISDAESTTLEIENCLFAHNQAGEEGGGAILRWTSAGSMTIANSTILGNDAGGLWDVAGGVHSSGGELSLRNTILWGNTSAPVSGEAAQLWPSGTPSVNYCCIEGWTGALGGVGNLGGDPRLADPDGPDDNPGTWQDNDFRLAADSPCIDAGDPNDTPTAGATDLAGEARVWDGDADGVAIVDMGAYEHIAPTLGDLNCDLLVNFGDIDPFVLALLDTAGYVLHYPQCNPYLADCNRDSWINFGDIDAFVALLTE